MDGKRVTAAIYDRAKFKAGNVIQGPAIIMEMDSTTVVLPGHHGRVDALGNVLIYPDGYKTPKKTAVAPRLAAAKSKTSKSKSKSKQKQPKLN
jgi:hypothetical protein